MKWLIRPTLARKLVVIILLSSLWPTLVLADLSKPAGLVTTMTGRATVSRTSLPHPLPLQFKDSVFLGDRISTAEDSIVRVLMGGKALVTIRELSIFSITEEAGKSTVDLARGKLSLAVARTRMAPGEVVEVRTPNAVAAVRGTVLVAEVEPAPTAQFGGGPRVMTSKFTVIKGVVTVATGSSAPVTLGALQTVSVTGQTLGAIKIISPGAAQQIIKSLQPPQQITESDSNTKKRVGKVEQAKALALAKALVPEVQPTQEKEKIQEEKKKEKGKGGDAQQQGQASSSESSGGGQGSASGSSSSSSGQSAAASGGDASAGSGGQQTASASGGDASGASQAAGGTSSGQPTGDAALASASSPLAQGGSGSSGGGTTTFTTTTTTGGTGGSTSSTPVTSTTQDPSGGAAGSGGVLDQFIAPPPPPPPPPPPNFGSGVGNSPLVIIDPSAFTQTVPLAQVQAGATTQILAPDPAIFTPSTPLLLTDLTTSPGTVLDATSASGTPVVLPGGVGLLDTNVTVSGTTIFSVNGGAAMIGGSALVLETSSITGGTTVLDVSGGGSLTSTSAAPLIYTELSTISASTLVGIGAGSTLALNGPLLTQVGGTVAVGTLVDVAAGGTLDLQADITISGPAGVSNAGTIVKSAGTGTASISAPLTNTGVVSINSGALALAGGGTSTGLFSLTGGTALAFGGGTYNLNAGTLSGAGAVNITAGSVNLNAANIYRLTGTTTVSGGMLNAPGDLVNLTGVALSPAGAMVVLNGSSLTATGDAMEVGVGGSLNLGGAMLSLGAGSTTIGGALLNVNGGTVTTSGSARMLNQTGGILTANGLLMANAGTLTLSTSSPLFTVSGGSTLQVIGHALDLTNTSLNLGSQTLINLAAGSTLTLNGSFLRMNGGTVTVDTLGLLDPTSILNINAGSPFVDLTNATVTTTNPSVGTIGNGDLGSIAFGAGVPIIRMDNSTFTMTSGDLSMVLGDTAFVNPFNGLALVMTNNSVLTQNEGTIVGFEGGVSSTSTSIAPLIQLTNSTLNLNQTVFPGSQHAMVVARFAGTAGTINGPLLSATNSTINITGDGNLLWVDDGSSLTRTGAGTGATFQFSGGSLTVPNETILIRPGAILALNNPLLAATGTTFNLGADTGFTDAVLRITAENGIGAGTLTSSTTSPLLSFNGGSLTTQTGEDLIHVGRNPGDGAATLTTAGPVLQLQNLAAGNFSVGSGTLFRVSGGSTLSVGGPFLDMTNTVLNLSGPVAILNNAGSQLINTIGPRVRINGGSLTALALLQTDNTATVNTITGSLLDLTNTTVTLQQLANRPVGPSAFTVTRTLAVGEPFVVMTDSTVNLTAGNQAIFSALTFANNIGVGALLQGGVGLVTNGASNTINLTDNLLAFLSGGSGSITLTDAGSDGISFVDLTNTTVTVTGATAGGVPLLDLYGTVISQATDPLVSLTNSTLDTTATTVASALLQVNSGATFTMAGPLLTATNSTLSLSGAPLALSGGSTLTSTTTSPFMDFTGGSLSLGLRAVFLNPGSTVTVGGTLFKADGTTITPNQTLPFIEFNRTGLPMTSLTAGGPLIDLTNTTLDLTAGAVDQPLSRLTGGSMLANTAGPVMKLTNATLLADALGSSDGTGNTYNFTGSLVDLTNSTLSVRTIGDDPVVSADTFFLTLAPDEPFYKLNASTLTSSTGFSDLCIGGCGEFANPFPGRVLVATNGSSVTFGEHGLLSFEGGAPTSTTTPLPLVELANSTVNLTDPVDSSIVAVRFSGTSATVAGPLLLATDGSAVTTANGKFLTVESGTSLISTGTDPLLSATDSNLNLAGGLIGVDRGQVVANPAVSLVSLTGGTHAIASVASSAMFDLTGSATALENVDLGTLGTVDLTLGTDRPVHGGTVASPAALDATLLEMSGAIATVSGEQFLKVDTALLEATAPLLKVLAGATLTLNADAVNLASMAKLVAGTGLASAMIHLDASSMTINVGSLVNAAGGSYLNVLGDLIRLSNASILTLNGADGYLLRVSGGSVVDIAGALVDFVGTGNKVKLANTVVPNYVTLIGAVPVRLINGALPTQVEVLNTPVRGLGTAGTIENLSGGAFTGSLIEINGTAARVRIGR